MKYKIAIIDDEQEYLDFTSAQIAKFQKKETDLDFQIDCFLTGESFLKNNLLDYDDEWKR